MARTRQVGRPRLRIDRRHHRRGAVGCGNAGADVVLGIDRHAERGTERRGVGVDRERDFQLVQPLAGHRQTDLTTPVPHHEVDRLGRDLFRRDRQVAFVLAILIVDDDDHPAGADLLDGVVYRRKRTVLAGPFGNSNSRVFRGHRNNCAARATYFPTTSHSRFTGEPACSPLRFVCPHVNGMIMTSKSSGPRAATVRLTPSRATDPLGTKNGASSGGNATFSQRASPSTRTSRMVPIPSTCPWTK